MTRTEARVKNEQLIKILLIFQQNTTPEDPT